LRSGICFDDVVAHGIDDEIVGVTQMLFIVPAVVDAALDLTLRDLHSLSPPQPLVWHGGRVIFFNGLSTQFWVILKKISKCCKQLPFSIVYKPGSVFR
jgi:hypothetical protein